jgi:deazaflavin-dependent oxidoreductase (nitroreductase family)
MYRSGRPNWAARPQNQLSSHLFGAGLLPRRTASVEVKGRRSGRTIAFPVVVADWQGDEYLVSMLGERANWVKNVRAAGGAAVLRRGRRDPVTLEEIDVADRAPIIRRYAAVAPGGRPHLGLRRQASIEECEAVAPQTPVFRIRDDRTGRDHAPGSQADPNRRNRISIGDSPPDKIDRTLIDRICR